MPENQEEEKGEDEDEEESMQEGIGWGTSFIY